MLHEAKVNQIESNLRCGKVAANKRQAENNGSLAFLQKISRDSVVRTSNGIIFHTDGAAERNARAPIAVLVREQLRFRSRST